MWGECGESLLSSEQNEERKCYNLECLTERSIAPPSHLGGLFVSLSYKNQIVISACVTSILQFPTVKFEIEK